MPSIPYILLKDIKRLKGIEFTVSRIGKISVFYRMHITPGFLFRYMAILTARVMLNFKVNDPLIITQIRFALPHFSPIIVFVSLYSQEEWEETWSEWSQGSFQTVLTSDACVLSRRVSTGWLVLPIGGMKMFRFYRTCSSNTVICHGTPLLTFIHRLSWILLSWRRNKYSTKLDF